MSALIQTKLPKSASWLQRLTYPAVRYFFFFFFEYVPYWPIQRVNKPKLHGPFVWACSHSNFLCDAVPAGTEAPMPTKFLGKSTLFVPPLKQFIEFCGALPVVRAQDSKSGEHKSMQNRMTFKAAIAAMKEGWPVAIFPEGMSIPHPGLVLPLKAGVAKLALSAEEDADFKLGVTIIPVGLEYGSRVKVASGLTIRYGNPISLAEYKEMYRRSHEEAVSAVMERLTKEMISVFPHFENEHTQMLGKKLVAMGVLPDKHSAAQLFLRMKDDRRFWAELDQRLALVEEQAKERGIPLPAFGFREKWKHKPGSERWKIRLLLLLGSPIFFLDLLNNTIPESCVKSVVDYFAVDDTEKMTIRFLSSPVVLSLVYAVQFFIAKRFIFPEEFGDAGFSCFLAYCVASVVLWYTALHWRRVLKIFASLFFFRRADIDGRSTLMKHYRDLLDYLRHADNGGGHRH